MGKIIGIFISDGGVPKSSVTSIAVGIDGLQGDQQNNKKYHGGKDKAVCVLDYNVLLKLQEEGHPIGPGTTGENLLISGFDLHIGSIFCVGNIELEVTSAAVPCKTIANSFTNGAFSKLSNKKYPGQTRWYCKVICPGVISVSG